jgi:hypothetical protein
VARQTNHLGLDELHRKYGEGNASHKWINLDALIHVTSLMARGCGMVIVQTVVNIPAGHADVAASLDWRLSKPFRPETTSFESVRSDTRWDIHRDTPGNQIGSLRPRRTRL